MNGLLVAVLGIALIDSLNLSAIAVTLYLLAGPSYVPRVLTYLAAVFSAYFTIGVLLMLGLTTAATAVGDAFLAAPANAARQRPPRRPRSMHLGAVFVLGLTITVVEFSTALPYLGAIGLLTNAGVAPARWVPTLVAYNLIFVLPPFLLLVAYRLWGARLQRRFEGYRERLQRGSREAWLWILGLVGVVLLVDSLRYFDFFGLVDLPDVPPGQ
jgi:cytochrome c biogenesis protein CcdA